MRTGHSLTVCWCLLPGGGGGGVSGPGGGSVCSWGRGWRVSGPGGCLLRGGVWSGGSAPRGVWSRGLSGAGGLLPGCVWSGGVCSWGDGPGGVWSQGGDCIPACTEADPPCVQNSSHTLVKILPWPNFVAAGNNGAFSHFKSKKCFKGKMG